MKNYITYASVKRGKKIEEKENKERIINECECAANVAKERLIEILDKLYEVGAIRKAKSLDTIIGKLEMWQNK